MTDTQLIRLCSSFKRGLLKKREGDMMCAVVCYPLQGYLSMLGVDCGLEEVNLQYSNHVFLRLPDGRVLDPTADQFGGPKVYIGAELEYHREQAAKPEAR